MLTLLIEFSVRFRGVILALACVLLGYGAYALQQSRVDVFPEFAPPLVTVQTEAPGLAPEQVEQLVTQKIENALAGAIGLESMRSQSIPGVSVVTLIFDDKTDIHRARQTAAEALAGLAAELPAGVRTPRMTPLSSSANVVLGIGLTSSSRSLMELRSLAEWTLKPRLLGSKGVSDVGIYGGDVRQYQVQVDPGKLASLGLSLPEVIGATQRAAGMRGAGVLETPNQRLVLSTVTPPASPGQLGQSPLREHNGAVLRLADVGRVVVGAETPVSGAAIQGKPGVILMVSNQVGTDTMSVTRHIDDALAQLAPELARQGITLHPALFRPANFIQASADRLRAALLGGAGLVALVLFLFLFNWRTAAISVTAIPLSLCAAIIVLRHFDIPLTTMTLGGLAIALGEVVDDAIIDVENIHRRLRQNRVLGQPRSALRVVIEASTEVRGAVVYATLTVAAVFLPVLSLSGVAGKLFGPLGVAYLLAIMSSLLVALTVTPALSYVLLAGQGDDRDAPRLYGWLATRYASLLDQLERNWGLALLTLAGILAATSLTLPFFSLSYLPELREGHFIVHMQAAPGTALAESMRVGQRVSRAMLEVPGVRSVAQRAGRTARGVDVYGTQYSEFEIDLRAGLDGEAQEQAMAAVRGKLASFPGLLFTAETFLTERVQETLSGYTAPVVIQVLGPDLDVLDRLAAQVAKAAGKAERGAAVTLQTPAPSPQLTIRLRPERLAQWGFSAVDVMEAVQAAYQGVEAAQVYESGATVGVVVLLAPAARQQPAQVGALPLRSAGGAMVRLDSLADIAIEDGRYLISHEAGQRLQTVTAQPRRATPAAFTAAVRQRIQAGITFPPGYYYVFAGEAEAQARAQRDLLAHFAVAVVGICLLVYLALRSTRATLLVMSNLPFALVGGALMVFGSGGLLSLGSMVGFVTLFGITLRNAIMLLSHYRHLVEQEHLPWNRETALRGATERLVPILMTALVTGLGLLPLAWQSGEPGNEVEGPMAIVILGGLVSSTVLNLFILPGLAWRFARFGSQKEPV